MNPIKHLVILMMENRSFDHYYGSLSLNEGRDDVDGLKNPLPENWDDDGHKFRSWCMDEHAPGQEGYYDPPHGWDAAHRQYNNGANDGFVTEYLNHYLHFVPPADRKTPMGYYTRETLPVLYALADEFTICDRWFSSVLSSTWPNRKYMLSGKRDGEKDTKDFPPAWPGFRTVPFLKAVSETDDPDHAGQKLTWRSYQSDIPFLAFWYDFALHHHPNMKAVSDFVNDCANGTLPTVSIVDPSFRRADDHPSHDPKKGQKFIQHVVDALTCGPSWENCALVILYDENGGFYDHVPPPDAFDDSVDGPTLGFRVPVAIVGAYAKTRTCDHTVFDHTSIMKSLHTRWAVQFGPEYGTRWVNAPDIWSCFDFDSAPRPNGIFTGDNLDVALTNGVAGDDGTPPADFVVALQKAVEKPELASLNGTPNLDQTLRDFETAAQTMRSQQE